MDHLLDKSFPPHPLLSAVSNASRNLITAERQKVAEISQRRNSDTIPPGGLTNSRNRAQLRSL